MTALLVFFLSLTVEANFWANATFLNKTFHAMEKFCSVPHPEVFWAYLFLQVKD